MFHSASWNAAPVSGPVRSFFLVAAVVLGFASAQGASAATYTVTRTDDRNAVCNSGVDCSLREAFNAAVATPVADTIQFAIPAASCNAGTGMCTITLTSDLVIAGTAGRINIDGPGANVLTIDAGAGTNRIFYSFSGADLSITGVTLTGGNGTTSSTSFPINDLGGAIYLRQGVLALARVHVTGNSAIIRGGGVYLFQGTGHSIINSTFSGNSSAGCGGIASDSATIQITNSTFSGNSATGDGGAICTIGGTATLTMVTIASNSSSNRGGGIYSNAGTTNIQSTIVAGNLSASGPDLRPDGGVFVDLGYNLVGNNSSAETPFPSGNPNANNSLVGTAASPINPLLRPLANYGGETPTRALIGTSPAVDKGLSNGTPVDQRGFFPRIVDNSTVANATGGDGSDIGAYELQLAATAANVPIRGRVATADGRAIANVDVVISGPEGFLRTARTSIFGYYSFEDVPSGEAYTVTARSKRYTFAPRLISVTDEMTSVDITPQF